MEYLFQAVYGVDAPGCPQTQLQRYSQVHCTVCALHVSELNDDVHLVYATEFSFGFSYDTETELICVFGLV